MHLIWQIQVGKLTLKLYDKGERTLRAEVVVHNTKELGCIRSLEYFEAMVAKLNELMNNFINNISYAHAAIIDDGTMENLSKPVQTGKTRQAGINLTNKRNVALMECSLILMMYPKGFRCSHLLEMMRKKRLRNYTISIAQQELKPFLTIVNKEIIDMQSKKVNTVELHFFNARKEINSISNLYGIKIAS